MVAALPRSNIFPAKIPRMSCSQRCSAGRAVRRRIRCGYCPAVGLGLDVAERVVQAVVAKGLLSQTAKLHHPQGIVGGWVVPQAGQGFAKLPPGGLDLAAVRPPIGDLG